jgi:serine/threonine protein kinase
MTNSYEQIFLALAVRNKLIAQDVAQAILLEHRNQPEGARASIEELARAKAGLADNVIQALQAGAKRVQMGETGSTTVRKATEGAAPPNPADPFPGYKVTGKLGVGGTATVLAAVDVKNGNRPAAIKVLHPSLAKDQKAFDRFMREAQLLVQFDHENIVKGFAYGTNGPLAWLAMEFLEGESAQDAVDREKALSEARALEIILEAAKALEYMQSHGIIHRDIKPGNIMVLKDGRIKVCDLGFAQPIAQAAGGDAGEEETTSGTAQYMSPEQARGHRDIDVRADIYSLGATLYHMVMGELPFSGGDSLEVMAKQVMEALNSSEIKNRRISKHMHYFIERMMSKEKSLRYATPRELIDDITQQIEGFKSLEFNPDDPKHDSAILKRMGREEGPGEETPRKGTGPVTTRKFRKIDEITKRFRRDK